MSNWFELAKYQDEKNTFTSKLLIKVLGSDAYAKSVDATGNRLIVIGIERVTSFLNMYLQAAMRLKTPFIPPAGSFKIPTQNKYNDWFINDLYIKSIFMASNNLTSDDQLIDSTDWNKELRDSIWCVLLQIKSTSELNSNWKKFYDPYSFQQTLPTTVEVISPVNAVSQNIPSIISQVSKSVVPLNKNILLIGAITGLLGLFFVMKKK